MNGSSLFIKVTGESILTFLSCKETVRRCKSTLIHTPYDFPKPGLVAKPNLDGPLISD